METTFPFIEGMGNWPIPSHFNLRKNQAKPSQGPQFIDKNNVGGHGLSHWFMHLWHRTTIGLQYFKLFKSWSQVYLGQCVESISLGSDGSSRCPSHSQKQFLRGKMLILINWSLYIAEMVQPWYLNETRLNHYFVGYYLFFSIEWNVVFSFKRSHQKRKG